MEKETFQRLNATEKEACLESSAKRNAVLMLCTPQSLRRILLYELEGYYVECIQTCLDLSKIATLDDGVIYDSQHFAIIDNPSAEWEHFMKINPDVVKVLLHQLAL